jgi:hypothetical protein
MRAAIRYLHSPDADDLESWTPEDPECFTLFVQAMVGPFGEEGEESFDFTFCSAAWIANRLGKDASYHLRHMVLLRKYDYAVVYDTIERVVRNAHGSDWSEVAEKIARYGHWEFEDYKPYEPGN